MSEKKKFWQTPQHMEGFGQIFVVSEEQKLDWADIFFMTTLPKHLIKPHLFPQLPLPLRLINFLFLLCLYVILFFFHQKIKIIPPFPNYKICLKKL
jgi:hypothetical protein